MSERFVSNATMMREKEMARESLRSDLRNALEVVSIASRLSVYGNRP